jgi:hypothetical protein
VALIDQAGGVLASRNVPNGVEPSLVVIGGLPLGPPVAFGWGPVELLEDYGFDRTRCTHCIARPSPRLG